MAILSYLGSIYDLDTLDTRFTSPSSVPYKTVVEARADPALGGEPPIKAHSRSQPSKWRSPEFIMYYLVLSVVVPWMFWIAYDVSRRKMATPALMMCADPRTQLPILDTTNTKGCFLMAGFQGARLYVMIAFPDETTS
ncbi:hypothetical protein VDGD_20409 [Verticillium dahliae]|nr:hypothetical protein VDGD_20409 [Verticillium dahliae]